MAEPISVKVVPSSTVTYCSCVNVVIARAVVISVGSKAMVVLVQLSPTCPQALLATSELKAMYTLGDVNVNPSALTLVVV
jgi:hypothetical protein